MLAGIGVILVLKQLPHAVGYDASWEGEMEFFQADGHNTFSELYYALLALSPGAILIAALSLAVLLLWERPALKKSPLLRLVPAPLVVVALGIILNELYSTLAPSWQLGDSHLVNVPVAIATSFTVLNRIIDYWLHILLGILTFAIRKKFNLHTWREVPDTDTEADTFHR